MNDLDNTNEKLQEESLAQPTEAAQPADNEQVNKQVTTEVTPIEETTEEVPNGITPTEEKQPEAESATDASEAETTVETDQSAQEETTPMVYSSQDEILTRLKEIAESESTISRIEVESLKSQFYRIHKQQAEEARQSFIDAGGNEAEWQPKTDALEPAFKEYMATIREKRAAQHEAEVKVMEENYTRKLAIIERLKEILATPDDVNKFYNEFKQLQQQWNEVKQVPADKVADLWKAYQTSVEQYYDTLKLNNEFRAYDFKKNLEIKQNICERAEALTDVADVVAAFRQLQQLHQEFRETGPVERELREQVWARFKSASTLINKRHQDYFEERKEEEQANLTKKTELCEQIEAIDLDSLKTFAQWNEVSQKIMDWQKEWKTIGYATQKQNQKIFERFRAACDHFFTRKSAYFKSVRENLNNNLKKKQELLHKAESILAQFVQPTEESFVDTADTPTETAEVPAPVSEADAPTSIETSPTEEKKTAKKLSWAAATQQVIELQKQWKTIGAVPKRYSDDIWKRFNTACDSFFETKKAVNGDQFAEQKANKEKKEALIKQLEAIDPANVEGDLHSQLRQAQTEWNEIGHVPFRDKERLYQAFRAQMDRLYNAIGESAPRGRVQRMVERIEARGGNLRERLQRQYDILQSEIKTYENNLGFLTLSSKSKNGNKLVEDINRKVDKLRAELAELKQQILSADKSEETPAE